MKVYLAILILFISWNSVFPATDNNREEIVRLMKERKDRYGAYTESLDKKSGFFGNRTKNDIRNSSNKLVEILQLDNKIMNALQRMLEFKSFEKQNLKYDMTSYEERFRNLSALNDTLSKQNLFLQEKNKSYQRTIKQHNLYFLLIGMIMIAGFVFFIRRLVRQPVR